MNPLIQKLREEAHHAARVGEPHFERVMREAAGEIERLEHHVAKWRAHSEEEAARLDKLERYLRDPTHGLSTPVRESDTWLFWNRVLGYPEVNASGPTLREAIDKLP